MENLTPEEKKNLIKKMVICIILLVIVIIMGLVLSNSANLTGKLKGEVANIDEKVAETCDNLMDNYGYIEFRDPYYYDPNNNVFKFINMLPIKLTFTDRNTKAIYTKVISEKNIICLNCDYMKIMIPSGNYDIKVTKAGYLYNYLEDTTIKPNSTVYFSNGLFELVRGDLNGDGVINDKDLIEPEEKIQNINNWYKNGEMYTGEYILDQENFELSYGQTMQLTYHESDYMKTTGALYWYSTNPKVAKVENGLVTALSVGTTKISFGNSKPVNVTVLEHGNLILDNTEMEMNGIQTKQLNYTYSSDNTFGDSKPRWNSSNTSIVRVDENGVVTSLSKGTATVTATAGFGTTASVRITVNDVLAEDFEFEEKTLTFNGYEHKQIKIKAKPENATIYKYKYKVVDDTYATVTTDGVVTSKKSGSTKVKVTLVQDKKEVSKYVDININYVPTESISYENSLSFNGSETKNIIITYNPSNGLDRNIVATSNDVYEGTTNKILSNINAINGNVRVTSSYPGTATINFKIDREQGENLTGIINASITDVPILSLLRSGENEVSWLVPLTIVFNANPSNYTKNHNFRIINAMSSSKEYSISVIPPDRLSIGRTVTNISSSTITYSYEIDDVRKTGSFKVFKK